MAYPKRPAILLAGLLTYGGMIEVLQSFTPDRMAEWADLLADALQVPSHRQCARWTTNADRACCFQSQTSAAPMSVNATALIFD